MDEDPLSMTESIPLITTPPVLVPKLLLGLNTGVKGNVQFLSDDDLIYPAGSVLAFHNITQKKQKYIKLPDKGAHVNQIAISPNKKYLALCEVGEKVSCTLYDPLTYKKRKQIFMPAERDITARRIEAITFTCDSKSLIFIVGEPDWLMIIFNTDTVALESITRANNSNNTGTIVQVAPNTSDANLLVLVGNMLFRCLSCSEGVWRQFGFNKAENLNVVSACWLTQDRLLAGTSLGKLMYFENAELKRVYHANDTIALILKESASGPRGSSFFGSGTNVPQEPETEVSPTTSVVDTENNAITHLTNFGRGFVFCFQRGALTFFEKVTAHKYVRKTIFRIPDNNIVRLDDDIKEDQEEFIHEHYNEVNSIAISPSENRILVTCNETQIYAGKLAAAEGEVMLSIHGLPLHHGPICNVSVCVWKPIFMTAGCFDRTLRIWNYENETLELFKRYQEDIFTCDLHPTGFFAVVGFTDKIRVLKIMMNDFVSAHEYPLRGCKLVKYSKLGHLFAAVNGNIIQVYSSVSYEQMFNLKGHIGMITAISWSHDDYKLSSCGTEGAVYEWQISTTRRICETIIKVCKFSGLALTNDGKSNFAVGSDGKVREIVNSNVYNELKVTPTPLSCMAMANSDAMMFTGGTNGIVYTMLIPISEKSSTYEYAIHNKKIASMQITYDDRYVITASPSCICIWRIMGADQRMVRIDKDFVPSTDVMLKRSEFLDKMEFIHELQLRINEMQTEHSYQMRQTIGAHTAAMADLKEKYQQTIDELKEQNESLEMEHNIELSNINMQIAKMRNQNDAYVQELEASYIEKLIVEYDKYMLLEEKMSKMRLSYEKDLEKLQAAKTNSERQITHSYTVQLRQKTVMVEELRTKVDLMTREAETMKEQVEDDADREIYEIKAEFEKELRDEQDLNVRLRTETQSSKKMLELSQQSIDDLMHTLHTHEMEQHKLRTVIYGLEQSMEDLKNEIAERDLTIQDKEKHISELKDKHQELEKIKFILEFKIDELKAQFEPRDRMITEQAEQIREMLTELETLQKIIQGLELQLMKMREKLRASDNEKKREIGRNRAAKANLQRIKTDIHVTAGITNNVPKLKRAVRNLYQKHNADKEFVETHAEDIDAKREFMRQRDFLERTVKQLKGQASKPDPYTVENLRLVDQNAKLIHESNNLRKSLKLERKDNKRMATLLGCKAKELPSGKPTMLLEKALATKDDMRQEFMGIIEDGEKRVEILQSENTRLKAKIATILTTHIPKPSLN